MPIPNDDLLPSDLAPTAERLYDQRAHATPVELDELKRGIRVRAATRRPRGSFTRVPRFALTSALVIGLAVSGSGLVIAAKGGSPGKGNNPGDREYKPGKGCGDKNHEHEREDECKKPPK